MKPTVWVVAMAVFCSLAVKAAGRDFSTYKEVEVKSLKIAPEDHLNKSVKFTTRSVEYITTFLPYMDRSGFKAGKDFWLKVVPRNFPVIGEKKDKEYGELAQELKHGDAIILYGKVKKFISPPGETLFPHYYFDVEKIERLEDKASDALKEVDALNAEEAAKGKEERGGKRRQL